MYNKLFKMGKTRGVHETTPELRNRMVGMYEAGLGLREIATAINCSQRTVKRWLNRFDKEGTVETRERCGRKRATTVEQDEAIIRLASQSTITAAKAVLPALGLSCSVDTVRERLHKAGIHNWSPSRKHIQRIPLRSTDSAGIQQAVWRPTGTQHGKKKLDSITKSKTSSKTKFAKSRTANNCSSIDNGYNQLEVEEEEEEEEEEGLSTTSKNVNDMIPSQTENIFTHSMPPLNVSQCWPLDLVQNNNEINQRSVPNYREILMTNHEEMPPGNVEQYQNKHSKDKNCQEILENQSDYIMNCPNPQIQQGKKVKFYTPEQDKRTLINMNSCSSSNNNPSVYNQKCNQNKYKLDKKNKKGGKMKGTLETTIEIRNRMIGMSEAGLSTLSIALAINRSERTVKRWLERWHKEGNVQTKERKGRKRITTKEQDDAIIAMATQQPLTAAKHVAPALGLKCSVDTIRERLHKAGIHSWKLGKKQGEGNAVHTIHLWQPSGNRSNKLKSSNDKKRKHNRKKQNMVNSMMRPLSKEKKDLEDYVSTKMNCEPQKMIQESNNQISSVPYNSASTVTTQGLNNMSMSNSTLIAAAPQQITSSTAEAQMTILGPPPSLQHQPEPPCRLICSNAQPTIPCHGTTNSLYSSNTVVINSHPVHMEPSEPINFEPYIWTF